MSVEKFEDRRLYGPVNVVCKFDDGTKRNWITKKELVVEQIVELMDLYARQSYTLTLRQLHYQFVSRNWIVNHTTAYKKLGSILQDCRWAGIVDWDGISDRGRKPIMDYSVRDVADALNDTINQYKLDRQLGQPIHVELWTEKDALSEIIGRPASKYHVRLCVNKGYTSDSAIYDAYERFALKINAGVKCVVLYFGDHDPSGLDMIRDIRERLTKMLVNGDNQFDPDTVDELFEVLPIGLTMQQIKKYKLPPNPAKTTDSRSAGYIKKFGKESWEVDALDPATLVEIVETNILNNIDEDIYNEMLEMELKHKKQLLAFIKKSK